MATNQAFIMEMNQEAASTRKLLERVPSEHNEWRPHPKSMTLARLATHVAEIPGWVLHTMDSDELDLGKMNFKPHVAASNEELLAIHEEKTKLALEKLASSSDEDFDKMWTLRHGDHVSFTLPKKTVLRSFAFNHQYHHRAQLSLYLRLLDIPIPGMYGPTADERPAPAADPTAN